jgi:hypothetical protein
MTNRAIVFLGAGLLVLGLFVPIVQLPMGVINVFGGGTSPFPYLLLAIAGLAAFMAFKERSQDALAPGIAAGVAIAALFISIQVNIAAMRSQFEEMAADNPFAQSMSGMIDNVSIQWGWLLLIAGLGTIIYGALQERKAVEAVEPTDQLAKVGSIVLTLTAIGWLVFQSDLVQGSEPPAAPDEVGASGTSTMFVGEDAMPSDAAQYMKDNVEVYDLEASYRDSMLDGRVPGVDFKVRNNGDRTLDTVEVTVVFYNGEGDAIAEDTFFPVIVTSYDNDPPLRPGYIWQQERGRFYSAKSVPDEWQSGKVTAKVTRIEFSPEN